MWTLATRARRPRRSTCSWADPNSRRSFPTQPRDRAVDAVRRLLVGELVVVLDRRLQASQLGLQGLRQLVLAGLAVEVVHLGRIVDEVEQLPLVLLPVVDELVGTGPHAVVRARVV